jgi:hypothetical protein
MHDRVVVPNQLQSPGMASDNRLHYFSTTRDDSRGLTRTPADESSRLTAYAPNPYRQKSHAINQLENPLQPVRTPLPTPPNCCSH